MTEKLGYLISLNTSAAPLAKEFLLPLLPLPLGGCNRRKVGKRE